jgi:hypothetical protein
MQQPHEAADFARGRGVGSLARAVPSREARANQAVGHPERGVGQALFQVEERGDKDRSSAQWRVALDGVGGRDAALAREHPQTVGMDTIGCRLFEPKGPHLAKLVEDLAHVLGLGCARDVLGPGERRAARLGIDRAERVELGQLLAGKAGQKRFGRALPRPHAAREPGAFDRVGRRQDEASLAQARDKPFHDR